MVVIMTDYSSAGYELKSIKVELSRIRKELQNANDLKKKELRQQMFFIELIEEALPLDDNVKRSIHQRAICNGEW